jgi:hypothetical protein
MIWLFKRGTRTVCSYFMCVVATASGQTFPASVFLVANEGQWEDEFAYRSGELKTALAMQFKGRSAKQIREELVGKK